MMKKIVSCNSINWEQVGLAAQGEDGALQAGDLECSGPVPEIVGEGNFGEGLVLE